MGTFCLAPFQAISCPFNPHLNCNNALEGLSFWPASGGRVHHGHAQEPFHGFSVEFAEHRLHNPGESTKHLDWKLYARTDKMFVKRYEEETNLRCQIVMDARVPWRTRRGDARGQPDEQVEILGPGLRRSRSSSEGNGTPWDSVCFRRVWICRRPRVPRVPITGCCLTSWRDC